MLCDAWDEQANVRKLSKHYPPTRHLVSNPRIYNDISRRLETRFAPSTCSLLGWPTEKEQKYKPNQSPGKNVFFRKQVTNIRQNYGDCFHWYMLY